VAKPEWGTKRICLHCGARFYDLHRDPIVCPACGTAHDPMAQSRPRRARATAAPKAAAVAAEQVDTRKVAEAEIEEPEAEVEAEAEEPEAAAGEDEQDDNEDEDSAAIEDVSELGDDDMTDVIDTEIDEEEGER